MSVNIFGYRFKSKDASTVVLRGPAGIGFKYLDNEGNFDIQNKRLANIARPDDENDAVSLRYVNELMDNIKTLLIHKMDDVNSSSNQNIINVKTELINKISQLTDNIFGINTVINIIKHDIAINTSEIDHMKSLIQKIKDDVTAIKSTVIPKTLFENAIQTINYQLQLLDDKVNNL
jgi:hypothetical protein